jgi:hypothetical protein
MLLVVVTELCSRFENARDRSKLSPCSLR